MQSEKSKIPSTKLLQPRPAFSGEPPALTEALLYIFHGMYWWAVRGFFTAKFYVLRILLHRVHASLQEETEGSAAVPSRVLRGLRQLVILVVLPQYRGNTLVLLVCWCFCAVVYYGLALSAHNVK